MSTLPENELDLEKLFLPAWAQEPASAKHYAHFEGGDEPRERRDERRGRRPPGRPNRPGDRPRSERPPGNRSGGGQRPGFDKRNFKRDKPEFRRDERREPRPPPAPLPEINLAFLPEEKGVESLARQIRTTGRAYPLFDIARLILERPERYQVQFSIRKNAEGQPIQRLFTCMLDDTLWLSEDDAVAHVLKNHFATFYQTERTATEPPKGKYTFVAQCGMSGAILGPPNYHDYQNQLRKLHAERFSRMPFEAFKARVKIVRDEDVVKKWIDDQSWKTEYVCLNVPDPMRHGSRAEVEKHFRQVHKEAIIKEVESHTLGGPAARSLRSPEIARLLRQAWEDQRRFPLQLATVLGQQFTAHGLQFFKVNKTITHVSVARPHFLDLETTPVSEGVKRIVEFINATPKCTRRKLVEALAPAPAPPAATVIPITESEVAPAVQPEPAGPTAEQTMVIADLHWLIHQGHVIEFANGVIETAKKPVPRPPKTLTAAPAPSQEPIAADAPAANPPADAHVPIAETAVAAETPAAPPSETPEPVVEPTAPGAAPASEQSDPAQPPEEAPTEVPASVSEPKS